MLSMVSTKRMTRIAVQPPNQPASSPSMVPTSSETETESDATMQRGAGAIQDAREQVAAEIVGTKEVACGRGGRAGRTQAQQQ